MKEFYLKLFYKHPLMNLLKKKMLRVQVNHSNNIISNYDDYNIFSILVTILVKL